MHEYLCTDVLLWKRQEAYKKIKEDGITDESMEISVKEGKMVDGVYVIERFEFTAFCLLGTAEPCYESASLEVFSCGDFKQQLADMMQVLPLDFIVSNLARSSSREKSSMLKSSISAVRPNSAISLFFSSNTPSPPSE